MAIPVLIIGKSGSGKSTSLRNCTNNPEWNLVNVLNKPLPFKGKIPSVVTDDYQQVMKSLAGSKAHSIVIDDAGYLITNYFMIVLTFCTNCTPTTFKPSFSASLIAVLFGSGAL